MIFSKIRYAILSDIHGLGDQLEIVIEKLIKEGIEIFVFLGDYIGYGHQPTKVLDIILKLKADGYTVYCIKGNHDAAVELIDFSEMDKNELCCKLEFNPDAAISALWTKKQIIEAPRKQEYLDFLSALPQWLEIPELQAAIVHGSFHVPEFYFPDFFMEYIEDLPGWLKHINAFKLLCPSTKIQTVYHGHTHIPSHVVGLDMTKKCQRWVLQDIHGKASEWHTVKDNIVTEHLTGGQYIHKKNKKTCLSVNPGGGLARTIVKGIFTYCVGTITRKNIEHEWFTQKYCAVTAALEAEETINDFEFCGTKLAPLMSKKITG